MTNPESLACLARMHDQTLLPYDRHQARTELIEGNLGVATWAARRIKSHVPFEDLVQEASVVLIEAIDTIRADTFSSGPWVPGVPRSTGNFLTYLKAAMYHELVVMVGKERGAPKETRQQYAQFAANTAPFTAPDAELHRAARQQRLLAAFATARPKLTVHETDVLRVLYGLVTGCGLSMTETAIDLNLSLVRTRSLRDSAVRKIKSGLRWVNQRNAA